MSLDRQLHPRDSWKLSRAELESTQLDRLNKILVASVDHPLYRQRLAKISLPLKSLDDLRQIEPVTKSEMIASRPNQPGRPFHLPRNEYVRMHQTSGTSGHPMPVLDTAEDWRWWLDCWDHVLDAAEVNEDDIAMMAFSFGPFIGFWTANDALVRRGVMVVPGGGLSSEARLRMIIDQKCTIVCCTPTYALHLASVAEAADIDLAGSSVRGLIVAGEPGGSISAIRTRMQNAWGAIVIDHSGASEVGAWGFGGTDGEGLYIIETEFIAERLKFDVDDRFGEPVNDGEEAELVLTGLGRFGGPAIRYRTGDVVVAETSHDRECQFVFLRGGVLGRADDMMVIRGVNVFPSSIEAIVREINATAEFQMIAEKNGEMDSLRIQAELPAQECERLSDFLLKRLAMRVEVASVERGTLPRFQAKAKRWVDNRK